MSQMDKKIAGPSPENSRYVRNRVTGVQTIQKPSMKMVRKQLRGISRLSHSTIKRLPRQEIFGETCFFNTLATDNGRFLRHRRKRSERCLNYGDSTNASPRRQTGKVCRRPQRKTHVRRPLRAGLRQDERRALYVTGRQCR